jgi:glycosyltransferase involved in cell wall biosynthesis
MFADGRPLTPAIDAIPRVVSLLGRLPGASGRARRWLLPLFPSAVEDLSRRLAAAHARSPIDLLISTSSAAIKGLRPPPGVPHVCYIHAPARYLWSLESEYARGSRLRAAGLALFGPGLRAWDRATASSVTRFIANSHHTANLVRQAYSKIARTPGALHVVHPPVRTDYFTPPPSGARRKEFWLLVSALEPYKRVELAIDAAHLAGKRLVIAGSGSESKRLRAHADRLARHGPRGHAVEFVGRVSDETLRELYRTARLFVFPQIEDFGISAVEAQASGLPVVAYARGGALDTVIPRVTGAFFGAPSAESLAEATLRCPRDVDAICRACALRFAQERFDRELLRHLKELLGT